MDNLDVAFLYIYNDMFTGEVATKAWGPGHPLKPRSPYLNSEHTNKIDKLAENYVEAAKEDSFLHRIEVLLLVAHYLENGWSVPESLAKYVAKTLQDAVVAFGHTKGNADRRNAAIAKTFGLTVPRGAATKRKRLRKQQCVYTYMWWRKEIYSESLYAAAKHAAQAFSGTERLTQDACEETYKTMKQKKGEGEVPCLSLLLSQNDLQIEGVYFSDDNFLKDAIQHMDDTHPNKKDWMRVHGLIN